MNITIIKGRRVKWFRGLEIYSVVGTAYRDFHHNEDMCNWVGSWEILGKENGIGLRLVRRECQ